MRFIRVEAKWEGVLPSGLWGNVPWIFGIWTSLHFRLLIHRREILDLSPWVQFSSVQFSHSVVSNSLQPHGQKHARPLCPPSTPEVYSNSFPLSQWCHPTISSFVVPFSSCLQSCPASFYFLFHWVVSSFRWPKYWSFSFSISPANECSGLVSFRIDWLELLAVQGTLKSLLQHYSSKVSVLQHSPFFIVQLSHPYMTTGKTIALGSGTMKNPSLYGVQVHILLVKATMALTKNWWMQK